MTQEELDALMNGDMDLDSMETEETEIKNEEHNNKSNQDDLNATKISQQDWPPPPPTDEHKVVNQLDDVTRDSEVKATQIFDYLENLSTEFMNIEGYVGELKSSMEKSIEVFEKLSAKFPNVETFKASKEELNKSLEELENIIMSCQNGSDIVMMAMDTMQYQDIHRQKIERVINVMRALWRYMNSLFEGRVEDAKRVRSANHIVGDKTTDIVDNDDIEAILAQFASGKS